MKIININIEGISSLLIHKFSDEATQETKVKRIKVSNETPRDMATKLAYIDNDGYFYFNSASIPGCMKVAGANHKMVGTRKTLRFIVPSAVRMLKDGITILDKNNNPAKTFEVDSRPVTIPSTKGKIMRHRPRFDDWKANFDIMVNDDLLAIESVHLLLNEAGITVGIGDYRPAKGGPFGCFRVTKFEVVDDLTF